MSVIREVTEQMIIAEARNHIMPPICIDPEKPVRVKQQRICLKETGQKYIGPQISNRRGLEEFCYRVNENEAYEKFSIIAVNAQCYPIGIYSIQGSLSEVSAYPRVVVTYALLSNAHSVFFTHNHPGGTCAPSAEDIASTIQLQRILRELGIHVLDHLITTPDGGAYSMAQHGDITFGRG